VSLRSAIEHYSGQDLREHYLKKRISVPAAALLVAGLVLVGSTPASAASASYGNQSCGTGVRAGVYVTGEKYLTATGTNGPFSYGYSWNTFLGLLEGHKSVFSVQNVSTTRASATGLFADKLSGKGCYTSAAGKY